MEVDDDGILFVVNVLREDFRDRSEDEIVIRSFAPFPSNLFHVHCELVEQMVDEIGREDTHPHFILHVSCLSFDDDVESKDYCILLTSLQHFQSLSRVSFLHRPDVDSGYSDL